MKIKKIISFLPMMALPFFFTGIIIKPSRAPAKWCPYCNQELKAVKQKSEEKKEGGIRFVKETGFYVCVNPKCPGSKKRKNEVSMVKGRQIGEPYDVISPVETGDLIIDKLELEIIGFKKRFHKNILDEIIETIKKEEIANGGKTKSFRYVSEPEMPRRELPRHDFGDTEKMFPRLPINPLIPGITKIQRTRREEIPAKRAPPDFTGPMRLTILTDISSSMWTPEPGVFEGSRWESAWMLTLGFIECAAARKDILSVILYTTEVFPIVKESMNYEKAFNKIYPMRNIPTGGASINTAVSVASDIAENGKTSTILITDAESVSEIIEGKKYINQCMMHGPVILLWITRDYTHDYKEQLLREMPGLIIMPDYPTNCEAFVTRNLKTIMSALPKRL
ncbi:MAG: hypothetical protein L6265_07405 [Thermoplasmatales archaeon]|nr:hypothetical protein [Thermoplasmatales archaeon]